MGGTNDGRRQFRLPAEQREEADSLLRREGGIAALLTDLLQVDRQTAPYREGSLRDWLRDEAAFFAEAETAPDPGPAPDALELARLRGKEEERAALAASLQAERREISEARAKIERERRELHEERDSFEREYRGAVTAFNQEVQDRNARRIEREEAVLAEGRRDLYGVLQQWDLYGRTSELALRAVRQAAEQIIQQQVDGSAIEPATALLLAARLIVRVAGHWNPEMATVRLRLPDGSTKTYHPRLMEPGYRTNTYNTPHLLGLASVVEGIAQDAATKRPLAVDALPRSSPAPSLPEAPLPQRIGRQLP